MLGKIFQQIQQRPSAQKPSTVKGDGFILELVIFGLVILLVIIVF
jgi:hypothetical protein